MSLIQQTRGLSQRSRVAVILGVAALVLVVAALAPPIAQDPSYHAFADTRPFLGIPNFNDVISNLPFLAVGIFGLIFLGRVQPRSADPRHSLRLPLGVYFVGVAMVGAGSAYYHINPTNQTLFWDRLPMTIAFMGLFSAFIVDRVDGKWGLALLPVLIGIGALSVVYWSMTEAAGRGDLRPYAIVQFFPMLAIPVICVLFAPRRLAVRYVILMGGLYALAKVFEHFDHSVFDLLGGTLSGHSLKHLAAAAAAYMALPMLKHPASPPQG